MMTDSVNPAAHVHALLAGLGGDLNGVTDAAVTHLSCDSRNIGRGGLFLAMPGGSDDGRRHVDTAIAAGAAAVACEDECTVNSDIAIAIPDLRRKVGIIAERFYAHPSRKLLLAAVTGTNGKSTVAHLAAAALSALGHKCGVIGTLGAGVVDANADALQPLPLTTPDAVRIRMELARLAAAGARAVVLEASSHGLAQHRLDHLSLHTAVFTNLSRDHLDYHDGEDAYAAAKARLFAFPGLQHALVNAADPRAEQMIQQCAAGTRVHTFAGDGDIRAQAVHVSKNGLRVDIVTSEGALTVTSRLLGRVNVNNILAVVGMLRVLDYKLSDIARAISDAPPTPGRMEAFGGARGMPLVVVDYAHTPDALEKALQSLREHTAGELFCVFGCGGERDAGKRPLMGAVAARNADHITVTDDNPRNEDSAAIINAIVAGIDDNANITVTPSRTDAITETVARAGEGDAVLIAGKGHETVQHTASGDITLSDRATVAAQLAC